jgi:beta-lactamase class A
MVLAVSTLLLRRLVAIALAVIGLAAPVALAARAPRRVPSAHRCLVPGVGKPLSAVWRPHMRSAIAYQDHRTGDVAFAVRTASAFYGYRPTHQEWSASVLKAMLLVAYLDEPWVAGRPLNSGEKALLGPMITASDNNAANTVIEIVGTRALSALAARVGMTEFVPAYPIWGESLITPADQTRFFLHIDRDIVPRHRAYAMHLLASIIPAQRWGIGAVAPRGWKLYFKGGWGAGTGLIDNQVALLRRGCVRIAIAVLTMYDGSHPYGQQTLAGIFHRLLRGLPTGRHTRYR